MKTNVALVIPNWNGKTQLVDCLSSLKIQSAEAKVVVVDNGSTDGSIEIVQQKFPEVSLVCLDKNYGFAGGVNRGIESVVNDVEYVALLNNDAIVDRDWLKYLMSAIKERPGIGIVTGKLMRDDKKHIDSTGEFVRISGMPYPRGRDEIDEGQYEKAEYVFAATGGASLYRTEMLKKIGLFDESFFAYFEDVDISFRAQLAGWKVWYEPRALAYHHIGSTSSKLGSFTRYHSVKNFILLYNKNMPGSLYWKYKPLFLWQLVRMKLGSIRDLQFWAFIKGFFVGALLIPSTLTKRRAIQKSRKVSIEYIDALLVHGKK